MIITVKPGRTFMNGKKLVHGGQRFECEVSKLDPAHTRDLICEPNGDGVTNSAKDIAAFDGLVKSWEQRDKADQAEFRRRHQEQQDQGAKIAAQQAEIEALKKQLAESDKAPESDKK